jgi:hypothetical protein
LCPAPHQPSARRRCLLHIRPLRARDHSWSTAVRQHQSPAAAAAASTVASTSTSAASHVS